MPTMEDQRVASVARLKTSRKAAARVAVPSIAVAILIAAWDAIVRIFSVPEYVVPAPALVWQSFQKDWAVLVDNFWPTAIEAITGFALGNVFAIALAVVFVHNQTLERALFPLAVILKTLPIVAIAPVLVLMLGNGYAPKIVIAALITFFPTLVNVVKGLQSVNPQQLELFRVLSSSLPETFLKLRCYAALPYLFSALKITAPSAVIGAIIAEWIGTEKGLGALIVQATFNFRTPLLYSTMMVASALAIALVAIVGIVEKMIVRWSPEANHQV